MTIATHSIVMWHCPGMVSTVGMISFLYHIRLQSRQAAMYFRDYLRNHRCLNKSH